MRKWLRGIAAAIELLATVWLIGWGLYVAVEDEGLRSSTGDILFTLGFVLGPGLAGIAVAWFLDRFTGPDRNRNDGVQH